MVVSIDEAGNDGLPGKVENFGGGPRCPSHRSFRSHGGYSSTAKKYPLRYGIPGVHRSNCCIGNHEVTRLCHVVSD
jgi:hypothetical protein